ncbi:THUMP domain-containing protein 1 homolog [Scaptodrosophila lebanonensis]|uniref:THUMP domain-containing protein 1 homolog n=1 Tax=Drosophila lebanonensis TaxID=7225 RepID=A0A6J2T7M8_DROLE|nr:THUMP domain-containing protein 1 homolog [Scaptodrosophila lebanonensis]
MEPNNKKARMTNHSKFKQNKKKYFQSKKQVLQVGQRGFLATCNINEKACVRECYNLLNHYADILYGPEGQEKGPEQKKESSEENAAATKPDAESDSDDLEAAAAKCREVQVQKKLRFQNVDTGTTNCVFIRTLLEDPVELGKHIVDDITATRKSMSRFVLRLVPIEAVCKAYVQDIVNAAGPLFDKHFLKEPTSYGIIFNHRYNQQLKRDEVITQLANLVHSKNIGNKVDLQNAKKSIIVEVLRGWCLISVIDNYLECKKFNLAELANPTEKQKKSNGEDSKSEKSFEDADSKPEGKAEVAKSDELVNKTNAEDAKSENSKSEDQKDAAID